MIPSDDLDFGQTIRGFVEGQKVFDRYLLKRILGRGGMGIVWLAWDEKLERDIALKFMPDLVRLDAAAVDELKRETRKSLSLTHPNIVRIHDYVDDAQSAAISMEYIEGATLSALRVEKPERVFEVEELREWISQVCAALAYAHEEVRVVHRDLKPANLMVTSAGKIKVTDFGIARSICDSASRMSMAAGSSSGTLVYMSPQQLDGEDPSASDDVYSLGATIYELLTSRPPFTSGSIYTQIKEKVPPSMSDRRAALEISGQPIPAAWEAAIAACLAKDPADRPQGAQQLLDMLEGRGEIPALAAATPPPLPETPSPVVEPQQPPPLPGKVPPKESRSVKKTLLTGLALLVVVVVVALFGLSKLQNPSIAEAPTSPTPIPETSSSLFSSAMSGDTSALALLQDRADSGEAEAQYNLGVMYAAGEGVAEDYAMAMEWFRKAAEQGLASAQYFLGLSYSGGEGVAEDDAMAIKWLRKAAEQGNAEAQQSLGDIYHYGTGVEEDDVEAFKWYSLAAEQGNVAAQKHLGHMYFVGTGVEEDDVEAFKWYSLAAEQGDAEAQNELGDAYSDGFGVEEDESESLKWYRLAADQGYAEAQSNLGFIYEHGYGVAKDKSEAIKWYRLAAEQGSGYAENKLKELEEEQQPALAAKIASERSELEERIRTVAEDIRETFQYGSDYGFIFEASKGLCSIELEEPARAIHFIEQFLPQDLNYGGASVSKVGGGFFEGLYRVEIPTLKVRETVQVIKPAIPGMDEDRSEESADRVFFHIDDEAHGRSVIGRLEALGQLLEEMATLPSIPKRTLE